MSAVDTLRNLPPGLSFKPFDTELIRLYLLPRVRGQADPFPGLIIEDDTAANTQPWKLFTRHGRSDHVPTFFYFRTNDDKGGDARADRRCDGGGSWKSQKSEREQVLLVDGEEVKWTRHNLNFDMGSGSLGWVMHEYYITDRPSLKMCRISFSGHGQKRNRVPDGCLADEPATQRQRVAEYDGGVAAAASWTMPTTTSFDQDFATAHHACEDQQHFQHIPDDEEMVAYADAQPYMVPTTMEQQRPEPGAVQPYMVPTTMEQHEETPAMIADMTDTQPEPLRGGVRDELVPAIQQQVDQESSMSDGWRFMDLPVESVMTTPCSCCAPNVSDMATGTQDVDTWEDKFLNMSKEELEGTMYLINAEPNWMSAEEPYISILIDEEEPSIPSRFQQQFEEARMTMEQVDQEAVPMPYMDSMATGGEETVTWEGFTFV